MQDKATASIYTLSKPNLTRATKFLFAVQVHLFCAGNQAPLSQPSFLLKRLFEPVNNNRLVLFRMLFGAIMAIECLGSVFTGRVREVFVATPFNFSFIGFEWLSVLHGSWMNYYYIAMSMLCIMVALGLFYRVSIIALALMWTLTYLAEKTHYNNHYYLMLLLSWVMVVMPAHRRGSLDVKMGWVPPANTCYQWQQYLFIGQIWILYTFAAIAKMNPDWLQAMPLKMWMHNFRMIPVIGPLFRSEASPWLMAYFGLLFDLLIVPSLLWRKTRLTAFFIGVFFHLSNSILFGIGTFPYLAIALCIFFASAEWLEQRIMRNAEFKATLLQLPSRQKQHLLTGFVLIYLLVQMLLPIRHWLIRGNVNWTEEGHRMAWRMMLRSKNGGIMFKIKDKQTGKEYQDFPNRILPREQFSDLNTHPDIIWQYAQFLKKQYKAQGIEPAIYAVGCCSLNGKACVPMINPESDLASVKWNTFGHNQWITLEY